MQVEGNAPIVTLQFQRADGTMRQARFLFDSGGGAIIFSTALAADLGLKPTGAEVVEGGLHYAPTNIPPVSIGARWVKLDTSKAFLYLGPDSWNDRSRADGLLPGKALEPYQIVLDYPRERFLIAASGCIEHRGQPVDTPFVPQSGHPRVVVSVGTVDYGLLLDTGATTTLARRDLLEAWSAAHPDWPRMIGAAGSANMEEGDEHELLLRVPEISWGGFHIQNVLFVSRANGTYSPTSYETPAPIAGALGGNVLKDFRVEIDYPRGKTYLQEGKRSSADDMDSVGLVLFVDAARQLVVRGIATTAAQSTKENLRNGDVILEIEGQSKSPWTLGEAALALGGKIGEKKRLLVRRKGLKIRTYGVVAHLL